jgi:hypothetical protein
VRRCQAALEAPFYMSGGGRWSIEGREKAGGSVELNSLVSKMKRGKGGGATSS